VLHINGVLFKRSRKWCLFFKLRFPLAKTDRECDGWDREGNIFKRMGTIYKKRKKSIFWGIAQPLSHIISIDLFTQFHYLHFFRLMSIVRDALMNIIMFSGWGFVGMVFSGLSWIFKILKISKSSLILMGKCGKIKVINVSIS